MTANKYSPFSFCFISQLPFFELHKKWLLEMYEAFIGNTNSYNIEFYISLIFNYFMHNVDSRNEIAISFTDRLIRYRNYREIGITLPNFTFKALFKSIAPENIMVLIKLILLERKLILIKTDCSKNALIIESLFQLINPLYFYDNTVVNGSSLIFHS
jgi:hypothetical protein